MSLLMFFAILFALAFCFAVTGTWRGTWSPAIHGLFAWAVFGWVVAAAFLFAWWWAPIAFIAVFLLVGISYFLLAQLRRHRAQAAHG